ncbi:hypothetical protein BDN72DRAFT_896568 [Pluteus cervinus]|uniref:Uncharacterized protein n=1 Tax=Pluteus cervinus TaxID=181527 RepID=A0ACD3AX78_9AGAR|nr:hypothetical protein BDN72DRAFT_896568 [Pluteus cervinus]
MARFLQPKLASEITSSAESLGGLVVYINLSRYSCDAMVILPECDDVLHVPLPELDLHVLHVTRKLFFGYIQGKGREEVTFKRIGKLVKAPDSSQRSRLAGLYLTCAEVLPYLWRTVVKPVLDSLAIQPRITKSSADLPRIWWCPSGPLASLPLHAAGRYRNEFGDNIFDYVVSSYLPSAAAASYITRREESTRQFRLLTTANPEGSGLPGTERELSIIKEHATNLETTELRGKEATIEATKRETMFASWVHFSCHGVQKSEEPLNSALLLANRSRLSLLEISKLSIPRAEFAFLSACQTAKGSTENASESAHLAAGMLVAGYRSVIRTMWRISDASAPDLANCVYKRLLEGEWPDYRRAAYALHEATQVLRKQEGTGFMDWVPFIHLGV